MEMNEAQKLRIEWLKSHKSHDHTDLDLVAELYHGSKTGDYVCKVCGESAWGENWASTQKK